MSFIKYFAKNSTIRLMVYGVGIASAFIVTPHILRSLGSATYGVWVLISSLSAYFSLTNLASTNTMSAIIAQAHANNDKESLQRIFVGSIQLRILALVATLLIALIYAFIANEEYKEYVSTTAFLLSLFTYAGSFGLYTILNVGHGVLAGHMRWTVLSFTYMLRTITSSGLILLFLQEDASYSTNLLSLAYINMIGFLVESGVNFAMALKYIPLPPWRSYISTPLHKEILHIGKGFFVIYCGGLLRKSTQVYMVGAFFSTVQVSLYSFVAQILQYVNDLLLSAFGIMTPYFGTLQAKNDTSAAEKTLMISLFLSYGASSIIALGLVFYGDLFFIRWIGEEFAHINILLIPMALASLLSSGSMPANGYIYGLKKQDLVAKLTLIEGIGIVIVNLPALLLYGLPGLGWSTFGVTLLIRLIWFPKKVCAIGNFSLVKYYSNLCWALLPSGITQFLYYLCVRDLVSATYPSIILTGLGQALVACLTLFLIAKIRKLY